MNTTLPLWFRLRRAFFFALLLGLWAPVKIVWEQHIAHEQDLLRYHDVPMTRELRDELGQGLTIGMLSGMRSVVADLVWLNVTVAWEDEQWFKMEGYINLCTSLQPRSITFWDIGGWQLAWNASVSAMYDRKQPDPMKRLKASRFWIQKGLEVYLRGIENNPEHFDMWAATARLYEQRLGDYEKAAYYYEQASLRPDALAFYERFPAIMYGKAGDDQAAFAAWTRLWNRLTPEQRLEKQHQLGAWQYAAIRKLEDKLSIPKEKRVFPN